ncbi:probable glutathione peroxidase 2 isoform X3 [Zingiber officinale]|nr:probable glutathione peroxidase 2 isoform X3 [Zingiber officinale]
MYRIKSWPSFFVLAAAVFFYWKPPLQEMAGEVPNSIYDVHVKDISGNDVSLSSYSGKVLLVVNVASKCGLTHSNYKELNVVYEKYKDEGLEILAFPCNQFGSQEPGTNEEIKETVCTRFKAEFPIFDKVEVNGKNAAPLYKFLKSKKGGFLGNRIKWNFTKFLVDKDGTVVERYLPITSPLKIEICSIALCKLVYRVDRHEAETAPSQT